MSDLPAPLTPADCDLQDFAFMPLDVARLRDSDLAADESPESCWAAVLLWAASWHQVPAASIPDNDNWIAKQAGYAQRGKIDRAWSGIRGGALRGWVKCSDGRLYHPVVAEKARDAWQAKLVQRWKSECGRIKKHNQRHSTTFPILGFVEWTDAGRPTGQPLPVPGDTETKTGGKGGDKPSKGQGEGEGEGQGQGENSSVPNGTGGKPPGGQAEQPKTPEEMTKIELWRAGKSVLLQAGMPKDQCGTFVGMLCKDYGDGVVIEAVRETVLKQPADPASFLKAACMARKGEGGKTLIPWHATDEGVIAKGLELDPPLKPHPGQSTIAFKARVIAAVENDGKEPVQPTRPLVTLPSEPARMTDEAVEQGRAAIRAAAGVKDRAGA